MKISKGKMAFLKEKTNVGHKFQLTKKDIAGLLCFAWPKSGGCASTNNTATRDRGWNLLNRACLDDYKIQNSHDRVDGRGDPAYRKVLATGSPLAYLAHLNTTHGVSGESFLKFLHDQSTRERQEDGDPLMIQQKRRETEAARIANGGRLTAGLFVCAKGHNVNGDALAIIKRSKEKKEQES
jgi:hypothetical protein